MQFSPSLLWYGVKMVLTHLPAIVLAVKVRVRVLAARTLARSALRIRTAIESASSKYAGNFR
jgi:hypothetical protein